MGQIVSYASNCVWAIVWGFWYDILGAKTKREQKFYLSVEMTKLFQGNTISLSKALRSLFDHSSTWKDNSHCTQNPNTYLSPTYKPAASWITSEWQMTDFPLTLPSLDKPLTHTSRAQNHKRLTWRVQLTSPCFSQQLCPTSPLQPDWQMTAEADCLAAVTLLSLIYI